jgi:ribosomal subunit interface protein
VRLTVTGRQRLPTDVRAYAEEKLRRLERHAALDDVSLILDHDSHRIPEAQAEVIVHLHHSRLAAKVDGQTLREAIDRVIDKADEQIRRKRERVTEHKGRLGADAVPANSPPPARTQHGGDGVVLERRAKLKPMTLQAALAEIERRELAYLLFLDDDSGDVSLLARRGGGGYELVVADTL